jgi:hypothetical protein
MLLIDWIEEFFVSLPLRTSRAKVLGGAEVVKPVIAEEERQKKPERRKDEERLKISEEAKENSDAGHGDDGIRFSRSNEEDIPASRFANSPMRLRSAVSSIEDMGRDYSESFAQSLRALVRQRCGGKAPMAYKRAGLTRQSYSRIMSDRHAKVEKLTVLRLCIGLQLNRGDAEKLLASAGFGLSPSIPIDRVFIYCFEERIWNILDVCSIIAECGLRPFEVTF